MQRCALRKRRHARPQAERAPGYAAAYSPLSFSEHRGDAQSAATVANHSCQKLGHIGAHGTYLEAHLRAAVNGLSTLTPKFLKSVTFRVTTVRSCTFAVAAIIASS
jgi:hypothetical protein